MSKLNPNPRGFNTVFRRSTVLHPTIQASKTGRDWQATEHDYIDVQTIDTRGTWPSVHMIDEDTFVRMAILAGHITPDARKRYAHSRVKP